MSQTEIKAPPGKQEIIVTEYTMHPVNWCTKR
jgi:hypothetical protein